MWRFYRKTLHICLPLTFQSMMRATSQNCMLLIIHICVCTWEYEPVSSALNLWRPLEKHSMIIYLNMIVTESQHGLLQACRLICNTEMSSRRMSWSNFEYSAGNTKLINGQITKLWNNLYGDCCAGTKSSGAARNKTIFPTHGNHNMNHKFNELYSRLIGN